MQDAEEDPLKEEEWKHEGMQQSEKIPAGVAGSHIVPCAYGCGNQLQGRLSHGRAFEL